MSLPDRQHYPEAIVWDLDGTLVESAPDLATALNALLVEQGRRTHRVDQVRTMIGHGVPKLIERGFRAAGAPLSDAGRDALVPRFMELYTACATDQTHLVQHAREVLEHFYNAGIRQGLCTNKPYAVTRKIVSALDISGYFGSIVGGDSTAVRKPHALPLLTCLEELETRPAEAVMIGDSGADVGAARAAGVPVILVPDGYTGAPAVSLGADYVVGSIADIPASVFPHSPMKRSA
jgi:phosphoglycolate phosphatase